MPDYRKKIGTRDKPLVLKTPPGTASYTMHVDEKDGADILVCTVGTTVLHYDLRCIEDLAVMLKRHGDWMPLGSKDEKQETNDGTVEHWARSKNNPIGGWYGLKKNFRGRFGMYVPPLMEHLGLAEVEHNPRDNRMRSKTSAGSKAAKPSPVPTKVSTTQKTTPKPTPKAIAKRAAPLKDGAKCKVVGGTHKGKEGIVRDINTSKTGQVTITVVQSNGERFKTLARNVVVG